MPKFADIPQKQTDGHYRVTIGWDFLEKWIEEETNQLNLQLNPEFQRGHVWTDEQKIKFVEFKISGGVGSNEIRFNCKGWMRSFEGPYVLVDGLQRVSAVLDFINDKIPAFGHYYSEYTDKLRIGSNDFIFIVNNIEDYNDVLKWYIEINDGGTPHTDEEIEKVRRMIK